MKRQIVILVLLSLALSAMAGCFGTGGSSSSAGDGNSAGPTGAGMRLGQYQCWNFSQPRTALNFTVTSGRNYTGFDGQAGTYTLDAASGRLVFNSGFLQSVLPAGFHWKYHLMKDGRPSASIRNSSDNEVSYCEWIR
jgi:hypothetical protein